MGSMNLMPHRTYVVSRGAEKINVVKDYSLDKYKWNSRDTNLYTYTISDSNVNNDSVVIITSFVEFYDDIKTCDIMIDCPRISNGVITLSARNNPMKDISISYTVINSETGVLSDKATDITYRDNSRLGFNTVQSIIDKIISMIMPTKITTYLPFNNWISDGNLKYMDINTPIDYTLTDDLSISINKNATLQMYLEYSKLEIFYVTKISNTQCRIYAKGSTPTLNIPIDIKL